MINFNENMDPGRDRTRDLMICNRTRYRLRYGAFIMHYNASFGRFSLYDYYHNFAEIDHEILSTVNSNSALDRLYSNYDHRPTHDTKKRYGTPTARQKQVQN